MSEASDDRGQGRPGVWARMAARSSLVEVAFAVAAGVFCVVASGYGQVNMALPASLRGDHLFAVTLAKEYVNGHGFRLDSQLGFPGAMDKLYFPYFEKSYAAFMWLAARVTHNPFRIVHAMYIAGLLAMGGFGYWVLRRTGVRPWLAMLGAVAAVLTPFLLRRSFNHDYLALAFSAPLGLGLALRLGAPRADDDLNRFLREPFTAASIVVIGTSGLYYAFYTLMFCLFAGLAASLGRRRWFPLLGVGAVTVCIVALLLFCGYGLHLPAVLAGRFPQPHRQPFEQILYGLDFPSAASAFRLLPGVRKGLDQAEGALPFAFANEGIEEWPAAPLTLMILAAPLVMAAIQARKARLGGRSEALLEVVGVCAVCLCFALLFGMRGGIGFLFNLAVSPQIRADSRLMPFLVFGAVVMLCALAEVAAATAPKWAGALALGLAAVLLVACVKPMAGLLVRLQRENLSDPLARTLMVSVPAMLEAKDRDGLGAVLELPLANWPEAPQIRDFDPYQHLLPYIYDRPGSGARWSYGANEFQAWSPSFAFRLVSSPNLAERARAIGFDGVLIEKRAYDPAELGRLQSSLAAELPASCLLYEDGLMVLYALEHGPDNRAC